MSIISPPPADVNPVGIPDFDTSKLSRPQIKALLARRDGGWFCHYCRSPLWPIPVYLKWLEDWHEQNWETPGHKSCPVPCTSPEGWRFAEIDHITPKSKMKNEMLSNLVLCCPSCNSRKGPRDYSRYAPKTPRQEQEVSP